MELPPDAVAGHRRTQPRTITRLVAAGAMDAELAALVWLLVEGRVPLVVAGDPVSAMDTVSALVDLAVPADRGEAGRPPPRSIAELARGDQGPDLSRGRPLAAVVVADSLDELFRTLAAAGSRLTEDEIRQLGVVLVQRFVEPEQRLRVVAAHYLRPVERDGHGHLQRRPPAVLATWDAATDTFEHFAWGVTPELAFRIGRTQADLERLQARRATFLHGLVQAGVTDGASLHAALDRYRLDEQLERASAGTATLAHAHDHHLHGGHEPHA